MSSADSLQQDRRVPNTEPNLDAIPDLVDMVPTFNMTIATDVGGGTGRARVYRVEMAVVIDLTSKLRAVSGHLGENFVPVFFNEIDGTRIMVNAKRIVDIESVIGEPVEFDEVVR